MPKICSVLDCHNHVAALPGLDVADDIRLKGAFEVYEAAVDARLQLVRAWVGRCVGNPNDILACMGKEPHRYRIPSLEIRKQFLKDMHMFGELISDSRKEIDVIRSKGKSSSSQPEKGAKQKPANAIEHSHLRLAT